MNWSFTNPGLPTRMHFTTIGRQEKRNQNVFNLATNVETGKQAKINAEQQQKNKKCVTQNRNILYVYALCLTTALPSKLMCRRIACITAS